MSAILFVKRIVLAEEARREFERAWKAADDYIMPYTRTDVLPQVIVPNMYLHTISNVNLFCVLHHLTILFIDQQQMMGGVYEVRVPTPVTGVTGHVCRRR